MIFWPKKDSKWGIFGQFSNFKMLYLLNRWTDYVQPVDADCWNAVFFTPGYLMIYSWVIRRLFACNCWMGIILQPFMDIFGPFFLFLGTPCQYGPMLKSDMTQGKSEIVSGTNFGRKNEKFEPFLQFFWQKNETREVFLANFQTLKCCIFWTVGPTVSNQMGWIAETLFFSSKVVSSCVLRLFADSLLAIAEKM